MRKIFARLAQSDLDDGSHNPQNSIVDKNFKIGNLFLTAEEYIAEGGTGVVFRVHSQDGSIYALKRTCVNDHYDLVVCKREIKIVSSLSHKNIMQYVDSKITEIQPGIYEVLLLTNYYPGNLIQLMNDRKQCDSRFAEAEILQIFSDICEAVYRLHYCITPIIHRDLKIENVLMDERKNFVLCDFGSATSRVLHPNVHGISHCQDEIAKYTTPAYRSPEMVNLSNSIPLGPQIDIWALGCILYNLCFFALPFGDSVLAVQSGNFILPDNHPYCDRLMKLIGYILCVDAFKRPDIYQVCALVFSLSGRSNPVKNTNNLTVPVWSDLPLPSKQSESKLLSTGRTITDLKNQKIQLSPRTPRRSPSSDTTSNHALNGSSSITTTVTPRNRPRPATQHLPNQQPLTVDMKNWVQPFLSRPTTDVADATTEVKSTPVVVVDGTNGQAKSDIHFNAQWSKEFKLDTNAECRLMDEQRFLFENQINELDKLTHKRTQSSGQTKLSTNVATDRLLVADVADLSHRRCPSDMTSFEMNSLTNNRHVQSLTCLNYPPTKQTCNLSTEKKSSAIEENSSNLIDPWPCVDQAASPTVATFNDLPLDLFMTEDVQFGDAFDAIREKDSEKT